MRLDHRPSAPEPPPGELDLDGLDGILARHLLPDHPAHSEPLFLLPPAVEGAVPTGEFDESPTSVEAPADAQIEAPVDAPTAVRAAIRVEPVSIPAAAAPPPAAARPPAAPLPSVAPAPRPAPTLAPEDDTPPVAAPPSRPLGLVAVGVAALALAGIAVVGLGAWWAMSGSQPAPEPAAAPLTDARVEPAPAPEAPAPTAAPAAEVPPDPAVVAAASAPAAPAVALPPEPAPVPAAEPASPPVAPVAATAPDRTWTVHFAYGSVEPQGQPPAWVRSCARLEIVGHTDGSGNAEVNDIIGLGRAIATRRLLGPDDVRTADVVSSAGATRPSADNTTLDGRRQNRRAEVRCLTP